MKMDRTCLTKRPSASNENSSALDPRRQEKEGRPRKLLRRTVESKLKAMQQTWGSITKLAQDRQCWRKFVAATPQGVKNNDDGQILILMKKDMPH